MPADLLGQLIDAGCFQLLRPRSLNGIGADVPASLEILEALARADALDRLGRHDRLRLLDRPGRIAA